MSCQQARPALPGVRQVLAAADASEVDAEEVAQQPGASLVLGRRDAWRNAYLQRASDLVDAVRASEQQTPCLRTTAAGEAHCAAAATAVCKACTCARARAALGTSQSSFGTAAHGHSSTRLHTEY